MRYSRQQHLTAYASLLGVLCVVSLAQADTKTTTATLATSIWRSSVSKSMNLDLSLQNPNTLEYRIAARLQRRLRNNGAESPSIHKIASSVEKRQQLLKQKTKAAVYTVDGEVLHEWDISLQRYPLWIQPEFTLSSADFYVDTREIMKVLETDIDPLVQKPTHAEITEIFKEGEIQRVTANVARNGQELRTSKVAEQLFYALKYDTPTLDIHLEEAKATVRNGTEAELGAMHLLATGRSNFTGSTWSRSFNVRKALREHVNNTLVAPGETYSFNNTLNGPVSLGNGWVMAKIIVNGADLQLAPGGGICQASTTLYRAILEAGFPVTERKAHSLYVSYYKEHGVGIDATIYPGLQDLAFTNDTDNYVLIQAYDDGYDAVVNIYGTPDGRTVALNGPYFSENAPEELRVKDRRLARNEIAWLHKVRYADGREVDSTILSAYRVLPNYVRNEYAYAK